MESIWTEKYRPKSLKEMVLSEEVQEAFSELLRRKETLPNFLLYGPPGSGKTTLSLILAKHYALKEEILELNASSDREISVIRGKIKDFASTKSHLLKTKVIIMDECDYLTADAQHCLRRVIEDTQKNTRFIFITNYISKVIDPIKSRLSLMYIPPVSPQSALQLLREIKQKEALQIEEKDLLFLLEATEGDLRRSITLLQSTGPSLPPEEYRPLLEFLTGAIPQEVTQRIFRVKTTSNILEEGELLIREGYPPLSLLQELSKKASILPIKSKALFILLNRLSEIEEAVVHGAFDSIQIFAILSEVALFNASLSK